MFGYETMIDSVQEGKKLFVKSFVTNEPVANALSSFIDAQTKYTKEAVKVSSDTATAVMNETIKAYKETTKFDYSKFGEGIMKAYNKYNK
jgi:hypothetical protein